MKAFQLILCFLCFTFPAFAQGAIEDDLIGIDVSFQFGKIGTKTVLGDDIGGIGGRYRSGI